MDRLSRSREDGLTPTLARFARPDVRLEVGAFVVVGADGPSSRRLPKWSKSSRRGGMVKVLPGPASEHLSCSPRTGRVMSAPRGSVLNLSYLDSLSFAGGEVVAVVEVFGDEASDADLAEMVEEVPISSAARSTSSVYSSRRARSSCCAAPGSWFGGPGWAGR